MDIIVITGAPGVGKTTLLPLLLESLPGKSACLDGDVVGRTRPNERTKAQLDLIQDNIGACAKNFAAWGAKHMVACYVLPSQERVERLVTLLRNSDHRIWVVALVADDDVLVERHKSKGDWAAVEEYLEEAIGCNNGVKNLREVTFIDTTEMTALQVTETIVSQIRTEKPFS